MNNANNNLTTKGKWEETDKQLKSVFEIPNYQLPRLRRHRKYICKYHEKGFSDWHEYNKHLLDVHFHAGNYVCHVCHEKYSHMSDYVDHLMLHEENNKWYECKVCNKRFIALQFLNAMKIFTASNNYLIVAGKMKVLSVTIHTKPKKPWRGICKHI